MTTELPDDPRTYWNEEAGPVWVANQQMLDRVMTPVLESIVDLAALSPGEHVLDLGCGSGSLTLAAAERIGDAVAVGVDVSEPLVEHARQRSQDKDNVRFVLGDAEEEELPASDVALSRFGVMFFRDSVRAFTNIKKALTAEGRCVFACWQGGERNPWMTWPMAAIRDLLPPEVLAAAPGDDDVPSPFRFADQDRLVAVLRAAGFSDVGVDSVEKPLTFSGSEEVILDFIQELGPLSSLLDTLDDSVRPEALDRVTSRLRELRTGNDLTLPGAWWLASAR